MAGEMEVRITSLGNDVGGISRDDGRKTVFVRGALPGETVTCRPFHESGGFIRAALSEILEPSPYRERPFCGSFGECGGCSLQHLRYSRQLHWKRNWVLRAFRRAGLGIPEEKVEDTVPSPLQSGYRNRVSFDMTENGPGLHRHGGDAMAVNGCPLLLPPGQEVFSQLKGKPLLDCPRISVRASQENGSVMVEFSSMPDSGLPELGSNVLRAYRQERDWILLPPTGVFSENAGGFSYVISPGCFFQVNTSCAELLQKMVLDMASGSDTLLDLYGGCGFFAIPAAAAGTAVTSVELNPASSSDGEKSATASGIRSIRFVNGRVRHFLQETVSSGSKWDTVLVDPPRAGLGVRLSRLLRRIDSRLIVYVSCNPFSLARDLGIVCERHWQVVRAVLVDMFPQTDHVETVVLIGRKG